jgi:glycosyltransferase involved in cell wall biosynthesis
MKTVLLKGPLLSKSGYGEHTRQIAKFLLKQKNINLITQLTPWGITPWYLNKEYDNNLIDELINKSNISCKNIDISFQVLLPNEWEYNLAKFNVGVTAGVETNICNPKWIDCCNKMDSIIVPSNHTKQTFLNSGKIKTPISIIPEFYFEELNEESLELNLNLKTNFNFLTVGVITDKNLANDRKNLFNLIKWFVEEFKNNKDVGLILKVSNGRNSKLDKKNTYEFLNSYLKKIKNKNPKVYLLHGDMNRHEMNSLYKHPKIKAFISCTRGEGFGLPFLEAAVAGLPIIATNWSAHTEFLNKGFWIKLNYNLSKVSNSKIDNNIFVENAKWAEVDEKDFKDKIKKFYKSSYIPKQQAKKLSLILKNEYSEENIHNYYKLFLGNLL